MKNLEDEDELALGDQVGLAGLVNQLGDFEHRAMHWEILQLGVNHETECEAQETHAEAGHQERSSVHASKADRAEIREHQVGFPPPRCVVSC